MKNLNLCIYFAHHKSCWVCWTHGKQRLRKELEFERRKNGRKKEPDLSWVALTCSGLSDRSSGWHTITRLKIRTESKPPPPADFLLSEGRPWLGSSPSRWPGCGYGSPRGHCSRRLAEQSPSALQDGMRSSARGKKNTSLTMEENVHIVGVF